MSKTILFYRAKGKYGAFSNFYSSPITIDEFTWPTVEHYFQAQKFNKEDQKNLQDEIRLASTPHEAAKLGRNFEGLRSDWNESRDSVMLKALRFKFTQHEDLKELLLSTGESKLIEDSPSDSYWGIATRNGVKGENKLGLLLMIVRSELRSDLSNINDDKN
ncbi:15791_t:CDS:2 [Entrophospora sp. SA101]|nr:4794_t:CDS:2 [Entrophospora sp. SA101]CAJ0641143.1 1415_t:CDS:2 [Entrophospora sp. SA101]CAJ0749451.1 15791_t:CDS:2 [Entrophospora sp. SA101]CAJ0828357.1 5432_t:CDS:2 [Entrophospora sp. SA101]CAJ0831924.1 17720_t:CDS:2 [Entrophospora sp. SA101]